MIGFPGKSSKAKKRNLPTYTYTYIYIHTQTESVLLGCTDADLVRRSCREDDFVDEWESTVREKGGGGRFGMGRCRLRVLWGGLDDWSLWGLRCYRWQSIIRVSLYFYALSFSSQHGETQMFETQPFFVETRLWLTEPPLVIWLIRDYLFIFLSKMIVFLFTFYFP